MTAVTSQQVMLTPPTQIGLMAGVTSQQGMLTPPRHLINKYRTHDRSDKSTGDAYST
jgi:hypothetical protein